jgi:hypothetical protein
MFARATSLRKKDAFLQQSFSSNSSSLQFVASKEPDLDVDEKLCRDILIKIRSTDPVLFTSLLSRVSSNIKLEQFEDLLEECYEFEYDEKESRRLVRPIYPPQHANYSSFSFTVNYQKIFSKEKDRKENEMFFELLRNAYANDSENNQNNLTMNGSTGGTVNALLRVNLIAVEGKDVRNGSSSTQVHSFEFEKERDYWMFISGVKIGINGESVNVKGKCRYISNSRHFEGNEQESKANTPAGPPSSSYATPSKSSILRNRFSLKLGANSSRNDPSSVIIQGFGDVFEMKGNALTYRVAGSHENTSFLEFDTIVAMALTLDHRIPVDHVLSVGIKLPAGFMRVSDVNIRSLDVQFASTIDGKRVIHQGEQLSPKLVPFDVSDHHLALFPLSTEMLGLQIDSSVSGGFSPNGTNSSSPFSNNHHSNKEISPLSKHVSRLKCSWEIEVYNGITNGKLLGKRTFPFNPFLETVSTRSYDADIQRIRMNSAFESIIASSPFTSMRSSAVLSLNRSKSLRYSSSTTGGNSNGPNSPPRKSVDYQNGGDLSPSRLSPKKSMFMMSSGGDRADRYQQQPWAPPVITSNNIVKQVLKYRETKRFDIEILEKQFSKALRINIKNASGLGGHSLSMKKSNLPSAYCTVYLIGKSGDRLTSNHAEVRTEIVKSLDPEWNKEILLQDSKLGIDEVQGVMVLIRDAASGILKHKHLGQVMIPIDCFLAQDEASFCLPLEPSYR